MILNFLWFLKRYRQTVSCLNIQEDDHIIELVEKYGCKNWSIISKSLPGRIGKQCRER